MEEFSEPFSLPEIVVECEASTAAAPPGGPVVLIPDGIRMVCIVTDGEQSQVVYDSDPEQCEGAS